MTREGVPHGKGVIVIGNGAAGVFKNPSRGDRHAYFVSYLLGLPSASAGAHSSGCVADMKASFTQDFHTG